MWSSHIASPRLEAPGSSWPKHHCPTQQPETLVKAEDGASRSSMCRFFLPKIKAIHQNQKQSKQSKANQPSLRNKLLLRLRRWDKKLSYNLHRGNFQVRPPTLLLVTGRKVCGYLCISMDVSSDLVGGFGIGFPASHCFASRKYRWARH